MAMGRCAHIDAVSTRRTAAKLECEECVRIGEKWVHLRTCQECGTTLCCNTSPQQHMTKHAEASTHPVIASAQPGEHWLYCYPDDSFIES